MNNDMMHATRSIRQRKKLMNSEINTKNLNVRISLVTMHYPIKSDKNVQF